jgi:hypothetical protein
MPPLTLAKVQPGMAIQNHWIMQAVGVFIDHVQYGLRNQSNQAVAARELCMVAQVK